MHVHCRKFTIGKRPLNGIMYRREVSTLSQHDIPSHGKGEQGALICELQQVFIPPRVLHQWTLYNSQNIQYDPARFPVYSHPFTAS